MRHVDIVVSGNVQGVFFRASTKERADELDVKGIVKNLPDGSVYIEAEGKEEAVDAFVAWCRRGPQLARVDNVDLVEGEIRNYTSFQIIR